VAARTRDLVRTVPLHKSQNELETTNEYSLFEYYLRPNFDFKQEIISYLDSVEVVEPKSLRMNIKNMILNTYLKYKD
jgi:predicted DNA-binding transcriptional regulator YafY